jgi:uncharacterized protein (DUF342 family)
VTLGAVNAGETLLEVGFDPKAKEELKNLTDTKETLEKNYDELEVNYQGLEKTKRIRKKLPDDKERQLVELQKALLLNKEEIKKVDRQIEKKQEYLDSL